MHDELMLFPFQKYECATYAKDAALKIDGCVYPVPDPAAGVQNVFKVDNWTMTHQEALEQVEFSLYNLTSFFLVGYLTAYRLAVVQFSAEKILWNGIVMTLSKMNPEISGIHREQHAIYSSTSDIYYRIFRKKPVAGLLEHIRTHLLQY